MDYRLYFLDRNDHIQSAIDLESADDDQALRLAHHQAEGAAMELWQGARKVATIPSVQLKQAR